jgi:hypothetical protein
MAITWKKIAYETDVITKALLTTKGDIIYASAANTPARLAIGTDDYILRVATDIPAWEAMGAPTAHELDDHTVPSGNVDFDLKQATDLVVMTVANEAALPAGAGTVAVGQLCWATGELSLHVCTVAA